MWQLKYTGTLGFVFEFGSVFVAQVKALCVSRNRLGIRKCDWNSLGYRLVAFII